MFCSNCGKELPEGSHFCLHCGQAINGPASVPPKRKLGALWIGLASLIVVFLCWLFYLHNTTRVSSPGQTANTRVSSSTPKATATETFHLRSECAHLGQKILDGNIVGIALTQDVVSHYDPETNRCYVQLTVTTADLSKPQDYFGTYLYDGQTGEMLAWARNEHEKKSGMVFDGSLPEGQDPDRFWNHATDFMNTKMSDDRKR